MTRTISTADALSATVPTRPSDAARRSGFPGRSQSSNDIASLHFVDLRPANIAGVRPGNGMAFALRVHVPGTGAAHVARPAATPAQIGRASCRETVGGAALAESVPREGGLTVSL